MQQQYYNQVYVFITFLFSIDRSVIMMIYAMVIMCSLLITVQTGEGIPIFHHQLSRNDQINEEQKENQCPHIALVQSKILEENVSLSSQIDLQIQKTLDTAEKMLAYSAKFRRLKFSLEEEELMTLAKDISQLCKEDLISLFFISAYLVRSCQILERQNLSPHEISKIMKEKINFFMNLTSIQTYRLQKYNTTCHNLVDKDYFKQIQQQVVPIIYKKFKVSSLINKDKQIEDIIMEMVGEAKKIYNKFCHLVQYSSQVNGGLSFHINYKIQKRSERIKMKRVKQKLLRDHFNMHGPKCLKQFFNIADKRIKQQSRFQNLLNAAYAQMNQIQFTVKDILRAKYMFNSVSEIRGTLFTMINLINQMKAAGDDVKMVQFENRLNKTTCDVIVILEFGQMPVEVQLALEYDEAKFQISHKMYELLRSKVFSPIVLLFDWFEKVGPQFLSKIGHHIIGKVQNSTNSTQFSYWNGPNFSKWLKEYKLLNQFFNLTSYVDLSNTTKQQLEDELKKEIEIRDQPMIQPFIKLGEGADFNDSFL